MVRKKFTAAHMNEREMDVLDGWQKFSQRLDRNKKVRLYTGEGSLEDQLADDHLLNHILMHAKRNYASGGVIGTEPLSHQELEDFRSRGRYGDTGVGIIGPRLRGLLDMLSRHHGQNPHDGAPEYFSLSGLFDSIGSGFKNLVGSTIGQIPGIGGFVNSAMDAGGQMISPFINQLSEMAPQLAGMAGTALGSEFGNPELGGMLGQMAGNVLGGGDPSQFQQQPQMNWQDIQNRLKGSMSQGLGTLNQYGPYGNIAANMGNNMLGGMGVQQAMGQGLQQAGQQNPGFIGNQLGQLGGAMQQQGFNPMAYARQQYNQLTGPSAGGGGGGSPISPEMLRGGMNAARSLYSNYNQGGMSPLDMARNAISAYSQGPQQPPQQQLPQYGPQTQQEYMQQQQMQQLPQFSQNPQQQYYAAAE